MSKNNLPGELLHEHVCDKCHESKPCVEGVWTDGGFPHPFFECRDCTERIRREYEERILT